MDRPATRVDEGPLPIPPDAELATVTPASAMPFYWQKSSEPTRLSSTRVGGGGRQKRRQLLFTGTWAFWQQVTSKGCSGGCPPAERTQRSSAPILELPHLFEIQRPALLLN